MKILLIASLMLVGCSIVSPTKVVDPKVNLQMDRTLRDHGSAVPVNGPDVPKPNLIFERELKYVPTTQLKPRITSGANNPPAVHFTTASEYWKGN